MIAPEELNELIAHLEEAAGSGEGASLPVELARRLLEALNAVCKLLPDDGRTPNRKTDGTR